MIINKSSKEDIQNKVNQKLSETSRKISDQLHYSVGDLTTVSSLLAFKDNITLNEFQDYAKKQIHKLDHHFILIVFRLKKFIKLLSRHKAVNSKYIIILSLYKKEKYNINSFEGIK